jgi:hypothetical protein
MTEIRECGRTVGGGVVAFTITWDGPLEGRVAWVVTVTAEDSGERIALVHERDGGAFVGQYVEAEGRRTEVDEDADLGDDDVTARFPAEVVGVAVDWPVWKAALVVDGAAVSEQIIPTT